MLPHEELPAPTDPQDAETPAWMPKQRVRAYIYRVLFAAAPLAQAHGIVSESDAALWLGFAGTVLGVGLAAVNTRT